MNNEKIEFVEIFSKAGEICRLRNPWPGTEVTIYQNDKKQKEEKGGLITFNTQKNEQYIIVPKGISPPTFVRTIPEI